MCDWGRDFTSVSMIFLLDYETVLMVVFFALHFISKSQDITRDEYNIYNETLISIFFVLAFAQKPEALKSLYRSPGYKKNQLVLCKNYVMQW